ncbi:MAG: glycosyl hydrolase 2 galactose-binding domain-containing protein, partial [Usitatibacter sp.]
MHRKVPLHSGWQLAHTPPQACAAPEALVGFPVRWEDAVVPGTVAAAIHDDVDDEGDYDADDWWYRTTFARPDCPAGTRYHLSFEGLATIAQVWLNGSVILSSR